MASRGENILLEDFPLHIFMFLLGASLDFLFLFRDKKRFYLNLKVIKVSKSYYVRIFWKFFRAIASFWCDKDLVSEKNCFNFGYNVSLTYYKIYGETIWSIVSVPASVGLKRGGRDGGARGHSAPPCGHWSQVRDWQYMPNNLTWKLERFRLFSGKSFCFFPVCFRCFSGEKAETFSGNKGVF